MTQITPTPTLPELGTLLQTIIERTWAGDAPVARLAEGAYAVCEAFLKFGNHHFERLRHAERDDDPLLLDAYLVNYDWAERAKRYVLLWRDVVFQNHKAQLLLECGERTPEQANDVWVRSREVLETSARDFETYSSNRRQELSNDPKAGARAIRRWRLQHNPWPVFRTQIETIPEQCNTLLAEHGLLTEVHERFATLTESIRQNLGNARNHAEHLHKVTQDEIDRLEKLEEADLGRTATQLEELEKILATNGENPDFIRYLENQIGELPDKTRVSVDTNGGALQFREVDFSRSVRSWMESEILPQLYEVWELADNAANGVKMSLLNIRNRILLLARDDRDKDTGEILSLRGLAAPLQQILRRTEGWNTELDRTERLVRLRLQREFKLSKIFRPEAFLPVGLQSSINRVRLDQNEWMVRVRDWFTQQFSAVRDFREDLNREEQLSISEKVVRYVQTRRTFPHQGQYSSIFLTSGYVGESFWTGRERELMHVARLVEQWRKGFRGSIMLTGDRLAGKTLFGHVIGRRLFDDSYLIVQPNSVIDVEGRKFSTTFDLGEALNFIQKYSFNKRPCIWIDDLETWSAPDLPLNLNVRRLAKFIDANATRMFVLCSTNRRAWHWMNRTQELDKVFQATINLDRMRLEDVRRTIILRHGATHKTLVNKDNDEISPQRFRRLTRRVYDQAEGNIGETLNAWSVNIQPVDDERVRFVDRTRYNLPRLLNADNSVLLSTMLLHKRTTDYRLSKLFGPDWRQYSGILQRLINVGLVKRNLDNWLEINEVAANSLARLLEREGWYD